LPSSSWSTSVLKSRLEANSSVHFSRKSLTGISRLDCDIYNRGARRRPLIWIRLSWLLRRYSHLSGKTCTAFMTFNHRFDDRSRRTVVVKSESMYATHVFLTEKLITCLDWRAPCALSLLRISHWVRNSCNLHIR
jgi:hypothetical protein